MNTVIITNCTNRKRLGGQQPLEANGSEYSSLTAMAAVWVQQLNAQKASLPAVSLYAGRSVQDAKRAAAKINARLMFASTGLGLVDSDHLCPAYNLTVAEEPNSIRPTLSSVGAVAADWWDAVNTQYKRTSPIAALAQRAEIAEILIALSSSYIDLVANDIARIPQAEQGKIRIFTSRPGLKKVPEHLKKFVMPYDERLESSSLAGTKADFPQRALRHYVEVIMQSGTPLELARECVSIAMNRLKPIETVKRRRASDLEVTSLLNDAWTSHNGSSTRLLRYLRDDVLVSCEQSRFRDLWHALKEKKLRSEAQ